VLTIVGGILLPTLLVALITACTEAATTKVRVELSSLRVPPPPSFVLKYTHGLITWR